MKYAVLSGLLISVALLAGCQDEQARQESLTPEEPVLQVTSPVLVTVDGSAITEAELDFSIARTLGETAFVIPGDVSGKMLESLVASRAMAMAQKETLSDSDTDALELQIQAYREELLVRQYVKANAQPQPVTPEMVRNYYQGHPEEFGGSLSRTFEVISTVRRVEADERQTLVKALAALTEHDDWDLKASELKAKTLPIRYRSVSLQIDLLDQPLRSLVENTAPGQVSALQAAGEIMRVKVISEKRSPVRPLQEVSADIRRKLAPVQFRQSVKALSQQALESVNVIYTREASPTNPQGS